MKPFPSSLLLGSLLFPVLCLPVWAAPLNGRIVDANQKPIVGATVRVTVPNEGEDAVQNFTSDAEGKFTAEVPAPAPNVKHLGSLRVVAPGYAFADFPWKTPAQTFTLAPGKTWGGLVLDDDEKPLPGVRVALRIVNAEGAASLYFGQDAPTVLTDAQGRWQFDHLPLLGEAHIAIADPRYQAEGVNLSLAQPSAPPLFAKIGATVTGRLLAPDKTPIANSTITSWSGDVQNAVTDAQGRFTIFGFAPGSTSLTSFEFRPAPGQADKPKDYIFPSQQVADLKEGETRDIGDWMAQSGMLVSGQVVDKKTKKGIPGTSVMLYDQGAPSRSHKTDKQGRFQIRISSKGFRSGHISSDTHLSHSLNNLIIPKGATTYELPVVELEPGVKVEGLAKIEDGSTFGNSYNAFTLTATKDNDSHPVWGKDDGTFSLGALAPGKYALKAGLPSGYSADYPDFELVSPQSFTVPPVGQKMVPVKVVLRRPTGAQLPPTSVVGRVLDEAGQGVAGVIVLLKSRNLAPTRMVSGIDGRYESNDLTTTDTPSVVGVERPGYAAARVPAIKRDGTVLRVADLVLRRRGTRFVGRVLDGDGKPVAGALVGLPDGESNEPVKSMADGTFTLRDLPAGDFTLMAAFGRHSARLTTTATATDVELRLAPPQTINTEALAQKWLARGGGWWGQNDFNHGLGVERMEQLALAKSAKGQPLSEGKAQIFGWFVVAASQHEPQWTRRNATRLLAMFPNGYDKNAAETAIALVRATSDEASDQQWASQWLEREKAEKGGINVETVTRYLDIARVARALKRPEAEGLLDFAAQIADQIPVKTRLSNGWEWGTRLASASKDSWSRFLEDWDAPSRLAALGGIVSGTSQAGDIEAAKSALQSLDALAETPAIKAAIAKGEGARMVYASPELVSDTAHSAFVRALSERDPAAALRESAAIAEDFSRQNALLWVANGARLCGDKTTATAALRQAVEFNIGNTEPFALAAWYGAQIDPALGEELFARARQKADRKSRRGSFASVGDVAYYLARHDPAKSRFLIEREWSDRVPTLGKKQDGFDDTNSGATKLVRAMLVIDPARAVEMATQLETAEGKGADTGGQRGRERVGWIVALVADEEAQARGDLETRF